MLISKCQYSRRDVAWWVGIDTDCLAAAAGARVCGWRLGL